MCYPSFLFSSLLLQVSAIAVCVSSCAPECLSFPSIDHRIFHSIPPSSSSCDSSLLCSPQSPKVYFLFTSSLFAFLQLLSLPLSESFLFRERGRGRERDLPYSLFSRPLPPSPIFHLLNHPPPPVIVMMFILRNPHVSSSWSFSFSFLLQKKVKRVQPIDASGITFLSLSPSKYNTPLHHFSGPCC